MSDPALAKLLTVDSALAEQETKLLAQLETIQAQRSSLQSVLEIFESDKTTVDGNAEIAPSQIAKPSVSSPTEATPKGSRRRKATESKAKPSQTRKILVKLSQSLRDSGDICAMSIARPPSRLSWLEF